MGVDTKLYVNGKYELGQIKRLIERITESPVTIRSHHEFAPGYFQFDLVYKDEPSNMHVFTMAGTPLGTATLLDLRSNPNGIALLKEIARVLGGFLAENDCDGNFQEYRGKLWREDGLAFFVEYGIIEKGIEKDDIDGLCETIKEFRRKHGR